MYRDRAVSEARVPRGRIELAQRGHKRGQRRGQHHIFTAATRRGSGHAQRAIASDWHGSRHTTTGRAGILRAQRGFHAFALCLAAWNQVHDAAHRAGSVQYGARSTHHFDAAYVAEIYATVVADVGLPKDVVVEGRTIGQHQDAIAVVARLPEASEHDGRIGAIIRERDAALSAQSLVNGWVAKGCELLLRDQRDRCRRLVDGLGHARGGGDIAKRRQDQITQLRLLVFLNPHSLLDRFKARRRNANKPYSRRNVAHHGRRKPHGSAVDLDHGVALDRRHEQRSGDRHGFRFHRHNLPGLDANPRGTYAKARSFEEQPVLALRQRKRARREATRRIGALIHPHLGLCLSAHNDAAHNLLERERNRTHLTGRQQQGLRVTCLVALHLDNQTVGSGRDGNARRRDCDATEIFSVDVHGGATGYGRKLHHRDFARNGRARFLELRAKLRVDGAAQCDFAPAVGLRVLLQALKRARNVEAYVVVGSQAIGGKKVRKRSPIVT